MEEQKVDLTKYPEGLQYLAKELDLPIPPEATAQREAFVMNLISTLVRRNERKEEKHE